MPGIHTFSDGSILLQPIANSLGVGIDKINLVVCQMISLMLAYLHYNIFSVTNVSRTTRITSPTICGLMFCYFCYGNAMKHLVALVGLSYAIMHSSPPEIVHKCVFLFAMGYLIFIHWYRWYILTIYSVDITGPMMILVQKLTVLAFSLHDAVLTGPACFYTDYIAWIDGTAAVGKDGKIEKPWRAVLIKLLQTWLFMLYIVMALQRVQYYLAWTLADAIFNLSGFGFRGYNSYGEPQWDLVSNVKPWKVETALNFKETLEAWNCCTMYWLRRVAYDRVPKGYRTLSTYLLSAVWHGFFLGYYVTFLTGALFTVSARTVRHCLRWRFQGNEFLRRFYDLLTFIVTKITLSYTTYPFVMLHLGPGLFFYRRMYFCLHFIAFIAIFLLPRILPPESKRIRSENIDDSKKSS
ncbi:Membrane-bound O-acyltransferase domain-containing protein 2 [Dirofilaria immitis]|nr:Membrane-bound O-acyltransferase domain-containing protein 2 [Dirofilaria immitis]